MYNERIIYLCFATILACPIIGILLLFGLGLSDTTYQGNVIRISIMRTTTEKSKINKTALHAGHVARLGITDTRQTHVK